MVPWSLLWTSLTVFFVITKHFIFAKKLTQQQVRLLKIEVKDVYDLFLFYG
jgi:hypothetical protein